MISTGPIWRTTRLDSRSTISVTAGSLSHVADQATANGDGSTSASSIVRPSALETIFEVTTTTSPSSSGSSLRPHAAATIAAGEVRTGLDLGQAGNAEDPQSCHEVGR